MPNIVEIIKMAAVEAVNASSPMGVVFGKVISVSPLKVNVEQRLTLDESHLILLNTVRDHQVEISFDDASIKNIVKDYSMSDVPGTDYKLTFQQKVKNKVTIYNGLKVDETVILIRVQGGQKYVILDRVVM